MNMIDLGVNSKSIVNNYELLCLKTDTYKNLKLKNEY